jgi:hypothetical protein
MRTARRISPALLRERLTARWISPVSGTPAVAVGTEVAVVVARPQRPLAAEQHQLQARRLAELVPHPQQPHPDVEPVPHRPRAELRRPVVERRLRQALLRLVDRRLPLAAPGAVVAAAGAGVISSATQTRMAPSILDSARWLAIRTACRRCSSGRRI